MSLRFFKFSLKKLYLTLQQFVVSLQLFIFSIKHYIEFYYSLCRDQRVAAAINLQYTTNIISKLSHHVNLARTDIKSVTSERRTLANVNFMS